jgi:hypothetical protein
MLVRQKAEARTAGTKTLVERDDEQEREQHLHPWERDTELAHGQAR